MGRTLKSLMLTVCLAFLQTAEAQDPPATGAVEQFQEAALLSVLDSTPQTVAMLVAASTLDEATVRAAIGRLWTQRLVRYRLVPVPGGDTTATGRPRRERAYYVLSPPGASGRPSPPPR